MDVRSSNRSIGWPRHRVLVPLALIMAAVAVAGLILIRGSLVGSAVPASGTPSGAPTAGPATGLGDALFVLLAGAADDEDARLVAIDTATGKVLWQAATGSDPSAVVSGDGSRAYVASGVDQSSNFAVTDTGTGEILARVSFPKRWMNTLPPYFPAMVGSPDDRWIFALRVDPIGPEQDVYTAAVFDTAAGSFAREDLALPGCVGALLLPGERSLVAICSHEGTLLSFPMLAPGSFGPPSSIKLSTGFIAGAVRVPGSDEILVVTDAGKLIRYRGEGVEPAVVLAASGERPQVDALLISPDGARVYIGWRGDEERISGIGVFDARTGAPLGSVTLDDEGWSMRLSRDGARLFVTLHGARKLAVYDSATLELQAAYELPGPPALIVLP